MQYWSEYVLLTEQFFQSNDRGRPDLQVAHVSDVYWTSQFLSSSALTDCETDKFRGQIEKIWKSN